MRASHALGAAAVLLAACAPRVPELVRPRPGSVAPPSVRRAPSPCYNTLYRFTCVLPRGFLITEEGPGPGKIMTLVRRSRTSAEEANLSVRVYPLRQDRLKRLIEKRVYGPLRRSSGVQDLRMEEAAIGARRGFEVSLLRAYATGEYAQRVFAFEHDGNAFLIEHAAPLLRAAKDRGALEAFVQSIAFR
ncbi:MAG: hypothetical protein ABII00_03290 [Elusimicrobiota bacterium]